MFRRLEGVGSLGDIGFGCLQLENLAQEEKAVELLTEAYRLGVRVFDTAAAYGQERHNEKVLGLAIEKIKTIFGENAFIFFSTKCGINFATLQTDSEGYEGSPEQIRESVELSLKTLNVKQIPLLYLHRINPKATVEELEKTFNVLKELAEENKVQYLGLSEPTKDQILLADEVFRKTKLSYNPFVAIQSACSVATQRALKNGVYQACQDKGIQFVSYTTTIRGLLDIRLSRAISLRDLAELTPAQIIKKVQIALDIPENDFRVFVGFFHESVIKANIACILNFQQQAQEWGCTPAQLALAWQKAKGMLPIPGTTQLEHLRENVAAMSIQLTAERLAKIDSCFEKFTGNPNPPKMLDNENLEIK